MFLLKILKTIINYPTILYSLYIAFGFFLSQFLNIEVYRAKGATTLYTWFIRIGVNYSPSIKLSIILCLIMSILIFFILQFTIPMSNSLSNEKLLNNGIIISFLLCLISQIIFSSVMRFSYEFSFCVVILFSIIIFKNFILSTTDNPAQRLRLFQELWDLLKILIPVCIGFPILMGGAGLISSFYKEEQEFLRIQLYRHIAMSIYFGIGAGIFLLLPIIKKYYLFA